MPKVALKVCTYLNKLHDKVELTVCVHLLNQQHDVWMFNSPKNSHLVLDHLLLGEGAQRKDL